MLIQVIRRFSRHIVLVLVSWFVVQFCFGGTYVVIFNLYLIRLGFGPDFIGLANASIGIGFALFAFPAGAAGARLGRRRMLIVGLALSVVVSVFIPAAMYFRGYAQKVCLVLSYGLYGASGTLIVVNSVAFLSDSVSDSDRPVTFTVYTAIAPIAAFLGSALSGFLPNGLARLLDLTLENPQPYGYVLCIPPVLYAVVLVLYIVAPSAKESRLKPAAKDSPKAIPLLLLLSILLVGFLRNAITFGINTFFNAYLDTTMGMPAHVIGITVSVSKLVAAPATILLAPLAMKKFGKFKIVLIGIIAATIAALPVAFVSSYIAAAFSLVTIAVLSTITTAAYTTFSQELVPSEWRALMAGSVNMAGALSHAAIAYGGGYLIMGLGYQNFFRVPIISCAIGALLFWVLFHKKR